MTKELATSLENKKSAVLTLEELHKAAHRRNASSFDIEDEYDDDDADCYFD